MTLAYVVVSAVAAPAVGMAVLAVDHEAVFVRRILLTPEDMAAFGTALDGNLRRCGDRRGA